MQYRKGKHILPRIKLRILYRQQQEINSVNQLCDMGDRAS